MRRRPALLGVLGLVFGAAVLASGSDDGQIAGEITALTNEGEIIHLAFADVRLKHLDTPLERETRSDVDGQYAFADVPPGRYEIRFEHPTHLTFARNDLVVRAQHTLRVNIQLLPEDYSAEESSADPNSDDPSRRLKALALPDDDAPP
jgi:hypothetical protein